LSAFERIEGATKRSWVTVQAHCERIVSAQTALIAQIGRIEPSARASIALQILCAHNALIIFETVLK